MAGHVMQHSESPTWCVNCGTFDIYCRGECDAPPVGKYDSRNRATARRMLCDLLDICGDKCTITPTPYLCQREKGHDGDHESECDNAQFHQRWANESKGV